MATFCCAKTIGDCKAQHVARVGRVLMRSFYINDFCVGLAAVLAAPALDASPIICVSGARLSRAGCRTGSRRGGWVGGQVGGEWELNCEK